MFEQEIEGIKILIVEVVTGALWEDLFTFLDLKMFVQPMKSCQNVQGLVHDDGHVSVMLTSSYNTYICFSPIFTLVFHTFGKRCVLIVKVIIGQVAMTIKTILSVM